MALTACDTQRPQLEECIDGWKIGTVARGGDTGGHSAGPLLAVDGGYVYGLAQHAVIRRLESDGASVWGASPEPFNNQGIAGLALGPDGSIIVAAPAYDGEVSSGSQMWVGAFSEDGVQQWYATLGPAISEWGATADVLVHPGGGIVVSWHDSLADGVEPRLRLARLDDAGNVLWSTDHSLAPASNIDQPWAEGAADLLPDGSILQLTAHGERLRLVHTAADGALVSDAVIEGALGWPMDLRVLPDGGVLVAANYHQRAMLLEVEPAGTVLHQRDYGEHGPFFGAMQWDPANEVLFIGGTEREASGEERPWTLLVDREGEVLASYVHASGGDWYSLGAAALPEGGFVTSRLAETLLIETVTPCEE